MHREGAEWRDLVGAYLDAAIPRIIYNYVGNFRPKLRMDGPPTLIFEWIKEHKSVNKRGLITQAICRKSKDENNQNRLLIAIAISLSMLIPGAFAQSNSSSATSSERAAAAKRELKDLEKARLIDSLRHSTLRMQAQSEELERLVPGIIDR